MPGRYWITFRIDGSPRIALEHEPLPAVTGRHRHRRDDAERRLGRTGRPGGRWRRHPARGPGLHRPRIRHRRVRGGGPRARRCWRPHGGREPHRYTRDGSDAVANGAGIAVVGGDASTIGGVGLTRDGCSDDCNLISGNRDVGVSIEGGRDTTARDRQPRRVCGDGTTVLSNGVDIVVRAPRARIGGDAPAPGTSPGNVIAASPYGIQILAQGDQPVVAGNLVGLDITGSRSTGGKEGIRIDNQRSCFGRELHRARRARCAWPQPDRTLQRSLPSLGRGFARLRDDRRSGHVEPEHHPRRRLRDREP